VTLAHQNIDHNNMNKRNYDGVDYACAFFTMSAVILLTIKVNFYEEISWWIVTLPMWGPTVLVVTVVLYFSGLTKLSDLAKRECKIKNNGN
jgi:hypothetical protein